MAEQLESLLHDRAQSQSARAGKELRQTYNTRSRSLARALRLRENQEVVLALLLGEGSPLDILEAEQSGALLSEAEQARQARERREAAGRAAKQELAERRASVLPYHSDRLVCPECDHQGARFERIPWCGGHYALGKTQGLAGTTGARMLCECAACGVRWNGEEPP